MYKPSSGIFWVNKMAYSQSDLYTTELLYSINLDKLKQGCQKKWFGSADITCGLTPQEIIMDESEPIHFVQILFNLKEFSYFDDKWMLFSRNGLISMMKNAIKTGVNFTSQRMVQDYLNKYYIRRGMELTTMILILWFVN